MKRTSVLQGYFHRGGEGHYTFTEDHLCDFSGKQTLRSKIQISKQISAGVFTIIYILFSKGKDTEAKTETETQT